MAALKRDENTFADDVHTILGPESTFEGKLLFDGTVRIDGNFSGEVRTDGVLVIGQTARLEAQVFVGSIIINGEVIGNITAKQSVEIHAPGKVRGNICTPQLSIAKGVIFEGACQMEEASRTHNVNLPSGSKVALLAHARDNMPD